MKFLIIDHYLFLIFNEALLGKNIFLMKLFMFIIISNVSILYYNHIIITLHEYLSELDNITELNNFYFRNHTLWLAKE